MTKIVSNGTNLGYKDTCTTILRPPLPFLSLCFKVCEKTNGRPEAARSFTLLSLVNRTCLESSSALLRLIGTDIAGDHGVVVALQRKLAVACDGVISGEL